MTTFELLTKISEETKGENISLLRVKIDADVPILFEDSYELKFTKGFPLLCPKNASSTTG